MLEDYLTLYKFCTIPPTHALITNEELYEKIRTDHWYESNSRLKLLKTH